LGKNSPERCPPILLVNISDLPYLSVGFNLGPVNDLRVGIKIVHRKNCPISLYAISPFAMQLVGDLLINILVIISHNNYFG
jgi:hypothetical protein